jgi:hypothetical protein
MTWVAVGVAGASLATSIIGGQKARKQAKAELMNQQIAEADAAQRQAVDNEAQAQAARDQLVVARDREVLSDQAEQEGLRQARMAAVSPDVEIASVSGEERKRRRTAFYEGNV